METSLRYNALYIGVVLLAGLLLAPVLAKAGPGLTITTPPIVNVPAGGSYTISVGATVGKDGGGIYFSGSLAGDSPTEEPVAVQVMDLGVEQYVSHTFNNLKAGLNNFSARLDAPGDLDLRDNAVEALGAVQNDPAFGDLLTRLPLRVTVDNQSAGTSAVEMVAAGGPAVPLGWVKSATIGAKQTRVFKFPANVDVTLTAKPAGEEVFDQWIGGPCNGSNTPVCKPFAGYNGTEEVSIPAVATFKKGGGSLLLTETSPKGGTTKISYTLTGATAPTTITCTGTACPGLPSTLPLNTKVTLDMQPSGDTGTERIGPYRWSGACAAYKYTQSCVVSIGSAPITVGVEFREQWRVSVSRADLNGKVEVSSEDKYEGTTSCSDGTPDRPGTTANEAGCPVGVTLNHWVFKGKKINILADGDAGYTFKKWESDCPSSTYGMCSFSNRAATVKASFKEFRYRLVVAKDCNPADSGLIIGTGLYCGTATIDIKVNGVLAKTLGPAVYERTAVEGLRGGVDHWVIEKYRQDGWLVEPPICAAQQVTTAGRVYYNCVAVPRSGGGHTISVTDRVTGESAYTQITELGITYRPRADFDADPFRQLNFLKFGTSTAPTPTTDTFTFALAPEVPEAQIAEAPVLADRVSMLASVTEAFGLAREVVAQGLSHIARPFGRVASALQSSAQSLLAALASTSAPADLVAYQVVALPRIARVGTPHTFYAQLGNVGRTDFAGSYQNVITVEQNINGAWVKVFTRSRLGAPSVPFQQYAFATWEGVWTPTSVGQYRMQYCVESIVGPDADTSRASNCTYYSRFAVTPSTDTLTLCGDADRSGRVTVTDALGALKQSVGDRSAGINVLNGDVNGRSGVSIADAQLILKASVGTAKIENVGGVCKTTVL